MKENEKELFEKLFQTNVNEKTEKKNGLTYLSWAWAWSEFKKVYSDATYTVVKNTESNLPYFEDADLGIMVYTEVTAGGITYEMWLPVMDGANNSMKRQPYTIKGKYGDKHVAAATMFDVNKTIMRCLVKNLAMFGLGLYIYAGEDLPEEVENELVKEWKPRIQQRLTKEALLEFYNTNKDIVESNPEIKAIFTAQKNYINSGAAAAKNAMNQSKK